MGAPSPAGYWRLELALELARELGYPTAGGELARAALSTPNRDVMHQV